MGAYGVKRTGANPRRLATYASGFLPSMRRNRKMSLTRPRWNMSSIRRYAPPPPRTSVVNVSKRF